ncbi:MAG: response regulator transcription factor [Bacteroidales bacterium]|nr:response regulator transcription factor [Bacteroidales bacterium]
MIRVVIVDDEQDAINSIELIINEYCSNAEVVGTASSAAEGRQVILSQQPDLVFLDIEMPRGNGFDLLEMLPERNFEVIFITAYNNFAIKAFKYSAIDYILKPIDIEEFIEAVDKAESRVNSQKKTESKSMNKYDVLLENLKTSKPTKIMVPTSEGQIYIEITEISRVEAEGSYSMIFLAKDQKILVSKNLKEFENMLLDNDFFRPHNSHLINLEHVKKYVVKDGGYIEMTDGTIVPISRRRKEFFIEKMQEYIGH